MSFVDPSLIPSTGNPALDAHHRRIAEKVNGLFEGWQAGWPLASQNALLDTILEEIDDHFIAEKMLTRGAGYHGWAGHEPLHDALRAKMAGFRAAVADEETHASAMVDAFRFFEDLIFAHEFDDDQDFWDLFTDGDRAAGTPLIDWAPEHTVGHEEVDRQHARLVALVNEVNAALAGPDADAALDKLLTLRQATKRHFESEEDMMRAEGHPDLKEHMAAHRMLIRDMDEACSRCRAGRIEETRDFVARGLKYWFVDHVTHWDERL